jgi:hypothetical protein
MSRAVFMVELRTDKIVTSYLNTINHIPQMSPPPPHDQTLSAQLDVDLHPFR